MGHITYRNSPVDEKLHLRNATLINANHQHTNTTCFRFQTVNTDLSFPALCREPTSSCGASGDVQNQ